MSIIHTSSPSSLDARIDDPGRQLTDVRRQWDALVPIASRIPAEILAEIFEWARVVCDYEWLAFSHVSHVWRDVALSDVHLWTSVDISRPRLTSQLLGRTGGAALRLYSSARSRMHHISVLAFLLPVMQQVSSDLLPLMEQVLSANAAGQRINSIHLDILDTPMLARLITPQASHLETLDLDACRTGTVTSLPDAIQALEYLSLRNLRLEGWSLDWTSLMVTSAAPRLRTLEIIHTATSNLTSTLEQMCAAFRSMTSLEVLVMTYSIPKEEGRKVLAPVSMPRLRSIQLEDLSWACLSLLQLIHKPETCQTKVLTFLGQGEEDAASRLSSCLGIPPQRISIRHSNHGMSVMATAYTTLHPHSPHHSLHLAFVSPASADIMRSLGDLLADLPQSTLLEVDASDLHLWCESVSGRASASVVEIGFLGYENEGMVASTAARWTSVFPNMRTLVLHINFERISKEIVHAIEQDVLVQRRAAGAHDVVRLFRCFRVPRDVWEGWPKLLRGVEIVWMPRQRTSRSGYSDLNLRGRLRAL